MSGNGKRTSARTARKTAIGRNGNEIPLGAHPGNTGGKKGRSGRRPDAIRELARSLTDEHRLLEVVCGIARGRIGESWFDNEGKEHAEPTRNADRINAVKLLLAYGWGQPTQVHEVEHSGTIGIEQLSAAGEAFEGRMARLTERLGAAAFPEFPE